MSKYSKNAELVASISVPEFLPPIKLDSSKKGSAARYVVHITGAFIVCTISLKLLFLNIIQIVANIFDAKPCMMNNYCFLDFSVHLYSFFSSLFLFVILCLIFVLNYCF